MLRRVVSILYLGSDRRRRFRTPRWREVSGAIISCSYFCNAFYSGPLHRPNSKLLCLVELLHVNPLYPTVHQVARSGAFSCACVPVRKYSCLLVCLFSCVLIIVFFLWLSGVLAVSLFSCFLIFWFYFWFSAFSCLDFNSKSIPVLALFASCFLVFVVVSPGFLVLFSFRFCSRRIRWSGAGRTKCGVS